MQTITGRDSVFFAISVFLFVQSNKQNPKPDQSRYYTLRGLVTGRAFRDRHRDDLLRILWPAIVAAGDQPVSLVRASARLLSPHFLTLHVFVENHARQHDVPEVEDQLTDFAAYEKRVDLCECFSHHPPPNQT